MNVKGKRMNENDDIRTRISAPVAAVPRVGYCTGPPDLEFAGRLWRRGVTQPVEDGAALDAMKARPDWTLFEFFEE